MDDKLIVTNRSALVAKYGVAGSRRVFDAVAALVAADATRGIKSRLVFLDDARTMRRYRGQAITNARATRENKEAIDAIFRKAQPDYLMILGSIDVVPHQDMVNLLYKPGADDDRWAYGDMPYACDAGYSREIAKFTGPTRVVGRLPDLTGAKEPGYLLRLLKFAADHKPRASSQYRGYFALSATSWKHSSTQSVTSIFGQATRLLLSPPKGPSHTAAQLGALAHFINCHGGDVDPTFYGQRGNSYPPALSSTSVRRKIKAGSVAAVECCYGAQLYDSVTLALPPPICQQYLADGAYGYFGSSTIAYGPAIGNGAADVITQIFLMEVLQGASLGQAALLARQKFVQQTGELDPVDLKTLGQFSLLGDPSIHPVLRESSTEVPRGIQVEDAKRQERRERRAKMRAEGQYLQATKPTAGRKARSTRKSPSVQEALGNIAKLAGMRGKGEFTAYAVRHPRSATRSLGKGAAAPASRYFVAVYAPRQKKSSPVPSAVAAVAKEVGSHIVGYRIYEGKSWKTTSTPRKSRG